MLEYRDILGGRVAVFNELTYPLAIKDKVIAPDATAEPERLKSQIITGSCILLIGQGAIELNGGYDENVAATLAQLDEQGELETGEGEE